MFAKIISFFTALAAFFTPLCNRLDIFNDYVFNVDASVNGARIENLADNVNVWDMGTMFYSPSANTENNIFDFVEYVQFMQCTGGSADRDLFLDPLDRSVTDDYDFARLVENCRGVLSLGAKPHLKLGSVPLKLTTAPADGDFSTNVYPPDDYDLYYDYIAAMCRALVDAFGREEVLSWRFGVMTEYENASWWQAKDGTPESSAREFCKLYDTTVAALQDEIGKDVYVGAHSMTVTEGLWDEELFIRHCAEEKNYRTGETGTRVCYLSSSFYDYKPGDFTNGLTPAGCVEYLRSTAEKYGLTDLKYGFDEGRILTGDASGSVGNELNSRTVGYTWQAAYDARLYSALMGSGADYFSSWSYLSGGLMQGNPTVSYHVARLIADYEGSLLSSVTTCRKGLIPKAEVKATAAYNETDGKVRMFVYNFKNSLKYKRGADVTLKVNVPQLPDGTVTVTAYRIDDDCNWFDEWCEDRKTYGITDDCFSWSPDDGNVNLMWEPTARSVYENELAPKYAELSRLTPVTFTAQIADGTLTLKDRIEANTVVFYEFGA